MNIYKDFKFTEDPQEQIAIGKEIAETYSDANIKQIKSYFDGVKDWEKKCPYSKEDMLYKSIYENWLYGIRPEQQIYFHLLDQPHEVKKTYMGQMDSFVYYARLNKKADMSLFEDKYDGYYDEPIGEWEERMLELKAKQETDQLFREAQGDNFTPYSQDFYDYWHDGPHEEDYSWHTY